MSYTYMVGWSNLNKFYYGVRIAHQKTPEKDLWNEYFTSSLIVEQYRVEYGEPDLIKVDKIFDNDQEARDYEYQYIKENELHTKDGWLNRACWPVINKRGIPATGMNAKGVRIASNKGKPHSEEHRRKISEANRGRKMPPISEETRQKMSDSHKGKVLTAEQREKISKFHKGRSRTDETRMKMSESNKARGRTDAQKAHTESIGWEKGNIPWNLGLKENPEVTRKRSEKLTGRKMNQESSDKKSKKLKGRKQSAEHVAKRIASMKAKKQNNGGNNK